MPPITALGCLPGVRRYHQCRCDELSRGQQSRPSLRQMLHTIPIPHTFLPGTITSQSCVPATLTAAKWQASFMSRLARMSPTSLSRTSSVSMASAAAAAGLLWRLCLPPCNPRLRHGCRPPRLHHGHRPLRSSGQSWNQQTQIKLRKILISTLLTAAERTFEAFARLCLSRRLRPPSHRCTRL